jgi:hypothetical protein
MWFVPFRGLFPSKSKRQQILAEINKLAIVGRMLLPSTRPLHGHGKTCACGYDSVCNLFNFNFVN